MVMAGYDWETLASEWAGHNPQEIWRAHSDAVNTELLDRWLPPAPVETILKTDLFDEAFGHGLVPVLARHARTVHGIDVSQQVVSVARQRHPGLRASLADVRALPFADAAFDAIVSISTLDHFHDHADIDVSLAELRRVLKPGGLLLLTLDNRANPVVAIRNALPFAGLNKIGLVPYFVGATYGPRGLERAMGSAGFRVQAKSATLHCPRVLAVAVASLLDDRASAAVVRRFGAALLGFERLARWPTRYVTGYYVAVRAVKV